MSVWELSGKEQHPGLKPPWSQMEARALPSQDRRPLPSSRTALTKQEVTRPLAVLPVTKHLHIPGLVPVPQTALAGASQPSPSFSR